MLKTIIQLKSEDIRQVQYYLKPQRNGDYIFNDYFLIKESRKEKMKKLRQQKNYYKIAKNAFLFYNIVMLF